MAVPLEFRRQRSFGLVLPLIMLAGLGVAGFGRLPRQLMIAVVEFMIAMPSPLMLTVSLRTGLSERIINRS